MSEVPGRVERWIGVSTDIHAQKAALAELAEHDRRKDAFLATLAHELRNPLAPIRYATRLLEPGTPPEMAAGALRMIDRQLAQMAHLLDDLLDVSRVTRGRLELRRESLDLIAVARQAVEAARPAADAVRHTLTLTTPSDAVAVLGDATRLAQVLGNVLGNAVKYMSPGGRIDVTVEHDAAVARIKVRDGGLGFTAEQLSRAFDLFARIDRGGVQTGLGIGLALARQLTELHGGELTAASDGPGRGSTFTLALPRLHERPALERADRGDGKIKTLFGGRAKVLIADDNVDAAESLAQLLELAGFVPHVVFDGRAAMDLAERLRPDIALLDLGMPLATGHDVARWIRARPWGPATRLVAITGWGQETDREATAAAGFDDHLTKPVDPDALLARLSELLPSRLANGSQ
jgi:CheY-like chemotaxis protein